MLETGRNGLKPEIKVGIARTNKEIDAHFYIREQVFVDEQRIFKESDKDKFDEKAIPLICEVNNNIVGTVRVFPLMNNTWMGGRLSILKEFRDNSVGTLLVTEAAKIVKKQGCTKFLAYIQPQNVEFFQKLGWKLTGKEVWINTIIHKLMEADLSREIA